MPIKVASECERHFISLDEAVGLIIYLFTAEKGRYMVNSPQRLHMSDIATRLYPNRERLEMPPRTGDRLIELFKSTAETKVEKLLNETVIKITSVHD